MRRIVLVGLVALMLSMGASGGQSARIGAAFSDAYGAVAPLVLLHRAYAEYLFTGTEMTIPAGVSDACGQAGLVLALMHVELLSQTASHAVDTVPRLARLRSDVAHVCDSYDETLVSISQMASPDLETLEEASQLGLFSSIYAIQQGVQFAFEAYLEGIPDEQSTWEFAVAFALRTLLVQEQPIQVDRRLQDILYGSEEATRPPVFVPADVAGAIEDLVKSTSVTADAMTDEDLRELVRLIYTYVLEKA